MTDPSRPPDPGSDDESDPRPGAPRPRGERISFVDPDTRVRVEAYWRRNLRYLAVLLAVWFTVSYGFGIVLAEPLNRFTLPGTGFPLGFWFAQQGSIYVFVVLIFVYVWLMNRLDREFDVEEGPDVPLHPPTGGAGAHGDGGAFGNPAGDAG